MTLRPEGYIPRLADAQLNRMLKTFGAVQVNGPKWCGKTWTCRMVANSEIRLDEAGVTSLVSADPSLALRGLPPHLIDEWQMVPKVRDAVRRAVDDARSQAGLYLLTGSSDPNRDAYFHSGAGRIGRLRLRPMSLCELGVSDGAVSLNGLFDGAVIPFESFSSGGLASLATAICRGGWPGALRLDDEAALEVPAAYLDEVFDDNMTHRGLSPELARRVSLQVARVEGQPFKITALARAMGLVEDKGQSEETARKTAASYLEVFEDLYILEPLYGWAPPFKSRKRLRVNPEYYFCDPSLGAAVLGVCPERLLREGQLFGMLFESLCVRDVRIYADTQSGRIRPRLYYYRDDSGLECDIVLERPNGTWGAIEIKLGENGVGEAEKSLLRLRDMALANPMARVPEPSFLAVLVGACPYMGRLPSGVTVVPLVKLGV